MKKILIAAAFCSTIFSYCVLAENSNVVSDVDSDIDSDVDIETHLEVDAELNADTQLNVELDTKVTNDDNELLEEPTHKVIIHANPLSQNALDMATPTVLISGEELTMKRSTTLGEILQFEPGLNVSSFGPAISRPVIRGLSGGRVKITNNQMSVQDASTTSADHDVGVEPLLAEQIEVIKGPATLLYGSGAIGGVVNTTDRKINTEAMDGISGGIEIRLGDSTTKEKTTVFTLDAGANEWNWHLDGYLMTSDDIKIPGNSESEVLQRAEAAENQVPFVAEVGDGILHNSELETLGGSLGLTRIRDWGYVGLSIASIDKQYGVPGHAHTETLDPAITEAGTVIDMQQIRYDVQTTVIEPSDWVDELFAGFGYTDYQHVEIEDGLAGTLFTNEAWEFRSYLKHKSYAGWKGVLGVQFNERDFAAIGEEAFVPPSTTRSKAIFVVEEKFYGQFKWELGARYESQQVVVENRAENKKSAFSFSSGLVYTLSAQNKLAVNVSHAARFASVEELYSFGPHASSQTFEIGNLNLDQETSNNIDFSYRFENDYLSGEVNFYLNQFKDFIFAANKLATDPCVSANAASEAALEQLSLVCYEQQDATFKGVELQLNIPILEQGEHQLSMALIADYTQARFDNGLYVPRIPPIKSGFSLSYDHQQFSADINWLNYQGQNKIALNELPTKGFKMLDLNMAYRIPIEEKELFLFLKVKNLLNEDARDHSSFLKDLAPRAGRGVSLGVRYSF